MGAFGQQFKKMLSISYTEDFLYVCMISGWATPPLGDSIYIYAYIS